MFKTQQTQFNELPTITVSYCSKVEKFQTQSDPQFRAQSGDTVQSLATTQNDMNRQQTNDIRTIYKTYT